VFEGFANVWTPVLRSKELKGKPLQVRVAGERLALFRDKAGRLGALVDRCPHRGVALSLGEVSEDGCLTCPFHGWAFQRDGACAHIPLNDVSPEKRARYGATAVPTREMGGLVWVFTGQDPQGTAPSLPAALAEPGWHVGYTQEIWSAHWTRAMENMLDTPHLPFIHRKSIGRELRGKLRADTRLKVRMDPAPYGGDLFTQWDFEEKEKLILRWRRPNGMELLIMNEGKRRMHLHVYCIPVDEAHTKMMLGFGRTFFGSDLITWLATRFNNVLAEDRGVIESSFPASAPPPAEELSVETDAPTLYFRKYYHRELRGSSVDLVPAGRLVRKSEKAEVPRGEAVEAASDPALVH